MTAAHEVVQRAVNRLLYAGMVLRYQSKFGHSYYLGWPGRSGTLRVSDHPSDCRESEGIYARITFNEASPMDEDKLTTAIATALGRYLLKAPVVKVGEHDAQD
jgi:hypothetical protein